MEKKMRLRLLLPSIVLLASAQAMAAGEAQAQAPTSVMQTLPAQCGSVRCNYLMFMANQWGTKPTGLEFAALIAEIKDFPQKDTLTGTSNGFFDPSQYASDCNTGLYIDNTPATPAMPGPRGTTIPAKPASIVHICKATSVPVVDASFVNRLQAAGLQYHLVYPIKDNGNGRAYVVWNSPLSGYQPRAGATWPSTAGYARIEGVGWQNQFQSEFTPHGDYAGDFIAAQTSPVRETTLRLEVPGYLGTVGTGNWMYVATMVTDDWLASTPLPPTPTAQLPPIPPYAPPGDPTPINAGGVTSGGGSGSPVNEAVDGRNTVPFDYVAFCNSPGNDGQPRSPGWVSNCMAGH
jgi:hypothetical protein